MFDISALDIIRDYFGYMMIAMMSIWVYQRSKWISSTEGAMRMDARAVQCVCLCMIVSIMAWQITWPIVGNSSQEIGFVLFAIFTRVWLVVSAGMAVISHWNMTEGADSVRNVQRIGFIACASAVGLVL
tara:strand:+ start:1374 stop:1760 length:387 start_codon:yes stop_codon:yes gene_type:complete